MSEAATEFPVPAFGVGDTVFRAGVVMSRRRLTCPDCGDAGYVPAQLLHETVNVNCPRCGHHSGRHSLEVHEYTPRVERLTIGSVRIDTHKDDPVEYMAHETGVGSGTIHRESTLFPDEDSALAHAVAEAHEKNTDPDLPQYQRNQDNRDRATYALTDSIRQEYSARLIRVEMERDDLMESLVEIVEYAGGADSALDDEYVMDRARKAIAEARGESA